MDIVDGSGVHDTCTCPDFLANELGTCKHVEAVRLRLFAARRGLRKAYARLGESPTEAVLTVDAVAELRLAAVGPWTTQLRARCAPSPEPPAPAPLEPALTASTLALPAAAMIASAEATATTEAGAVASPPPESPVTVESESEAEAEASPPEPAPTISRQEAPAQNRLRLARVVLDAGFFGDAVRAAYEALSAAVAGLADGARPEHHAALVAILYRDLLPSGKVPAAVPAVLARLHDLSSLEQLGVPVDPALARGAVEEAAGWVAQIAA